MEKNYFYPFTAIQQQKGMDTMRRSGVTSKELHTCWPFQFESYLTSGLPNYSCLFSFSVIKVKTVFVLERQLSTSISSILSLPCIQHFVVRPRVILLSRLIAQSDNKFETERMSSALGPAETIHTTLCQARQSSCVSHPVSSSS